MNNDAFLDPKECSQNKIPLKDINPDYETYESQPPEIIPIGSSDYQENNTIQKINTQKNKHIKQPTPNTFHIYAGGICSPLIYSVLVIFLIILCFVCPITLEHDGSGFFLICLGPLLISPLIDICRDKCCNYYNADIIMVDNLLKIKRRAWCKRNTKIFFLGKLQK